MSTIGIVYRKSAMIIFKQCDLKKESLFYTPMIKKNKDITYMSFEREGVEGAWCGINDYGVGAVMSDVHIKDKDANNLDVLSINYSKACEDIISTYKTAKEAVIFIKKRCLNYRKSSIFIISDKKESYYIENCNGEIISVLLTPEFHPKYFVSTNHFKFIHEVVPFKENHSTYLRLSRAEEMLLNDCSLNGVKKMLKDQYYGSSVISICREKGICPNGEEPYSTQATAIFVVNNNCNDISTYYQVNGNPKSNKMIFKDRIFDKN